MRRTIFYFLTGIALAACGASVQATPSAVTIPEGLITFNLASGTTSYLSMPLISNPIYSGVVSSVTMNSITVGDSPAPFTTNLSSPSAPYFVKFLSGSEMGRVLLITANSTSTLTLDLTDNTSQTVNLATSGFSVAAGDTFEVFPASTLASVLGNNTTQNPLILSGSTNIFLADSVSIFNPLLTQFQSYYFNTAHGCWQKNGSTANASNTILYPYSALIVTRRPNQSAASLVLTGRVAEVPHLTKTVGSNTVVFGSTGYAANITLSELQFGSNWTMGTSGIIADTVSVWNVALNRFDTFYQTPTASWRKYPDAVTDQSNFIVSAGNLVSVLHRAAASGASSFLSVALPYSLN